MITNLWNFLLDAAAFACELDVDGKVLIDGEIATGEKVVESTTGELCPPRHFSLCFQLPGRIDPIRSNCNFGSDGIFEGIVMKQINIWWLSGSSDYVKKCWNLPETRFDTNWVLCLLLLFFFQMQIYCRQTMEYNCSELLLTEFHHHLHLTLNSAMNYNMDGADSTFILVYAQDNQNNLILSKQNDCPLSMCISLVSSYGAHLCWYQEIMEPPGNSKEAIFLLKLFL